MKTFSKIFLMLAAASFSLASCEKSEEGNVSSTDGYFFQETFAFNLTSNPVISIPVVRLGTSGDLTVNITSSSPAEFTVPSSVIIKDGDRLANVDVVFDINKLTKNQTYNLTLNISGFSSEFGYATASAVIEYPTSYFTYGSGHICENWWAEEEDKDMYARDYATDTYQCYLPDCWGHDSGAGYPVQDYIFYWNTSTNKVYVPYQFMGSGTTYIADQGAATCLAAGNYTEGSAQWFSYIDSYYEKNGLTQPHYDPETKTFYLSDCYGVKTDGTFTASKCDTFTLSD